jgi:hypothetical protein
MADELRIALAQMNAAVGARCGATVMTSNGPYERQLAET